MCDLTELYGKICSKVLFAVFTKEVANSSSKTIEGYHYCLYALKSTFKNDRNKASRKMRYEPTLDCNAFFMALEKWQFKLSTSNQATCSEKASLTLGQRYCDMANHSVFSICLR